MQYWGTDANLWLESGWWTVTVRSWIHPLKSPDNSYGTVLNKRKATMFIRKDEMGFWTLCPAYILVLVTRRNLARCERDTVRTNVDIYTLVRESSIMRQDIRDILVSFDSGLIYQHVSKSFEMRWEQVKGMENETNVPFTLFFSSCLVLSRREYKSGITI